MQVIVSVPNGDSVLRLSHVREKGPVYDLVRSQPGEEDLGDVAEVNNALTQNPKLGVDTCKIICDDIVRVQCTEGLVGVVRVNRNTGWAVCNV